MYVISRASARDLIDLQVCLLFPLARCDIYVFLRIYMRVYIRGGYVVDGAISGC